MAEWKLCSDKGLSALPAAISERCHRYGDGRLFSLIIGNCECVSVPAHGYSNIKDTCQRKPVLWNLMSSTTTVEMHGLMFTVHSQAPHRWESLAQLMRTSNCSRKGPEGKELWQKICLSVSAWQKKKAYVRSVELRRTERDKKKKKENQWYCSRRDVWGPHVMLSLWWYLTLKRSWEMCSREGDLVTSHCSKLDDMQLFTT